MSSLYKERMRADLWNQYYAVGTEILLDVSPEGGCPGRTSIPAEIRDGQAVVLLEGTCEPFPLSRIRPRTYNFTPLDKVPSSLPVDDLLDRCPEL